MGHKYFENVSFRFPLDSASEPADCHVQVVLQSCLTRESCLTECCMEAVPLKEAQRNFQAHPPSPGKLGEWQLKEEKEGGLAPHPFEFSSSVVQIVIWRMAMRWMVQLTS